MSLRGELAMLVTLTGSGEGKVRIFPVDKAGTRSIRLGVIVETMISSLVDTSRRIRKVALSGKVCHVDLASKKSASQEKKESMLGKAIMLPI